MERTALLLAVAVVAALAPAPAHARPCTCDDIEDIEATLAMIDQTRTAYYSVLADIQGHSPSAPRTMEEAQLAFYAKMGWNREQVRKVGGLDPDSGQTVVDRRYQDAHCEDIVNSTRKHESAHFWYYMPPRSIIIFFAAPSTLAKILVRSEIDARDVEERFLKKKLAELKKKCKGSWKCKCTGEMFQTPADCARGCPPASLSCIAPTCLQIDPDTGKWTGKGL